MTRFRLPFRKPPGDSPNQLLQAARPPKERSTTSNHHFLSFFSTFLILLIAPAIALILVLFVFQSYQVDGPSMEPTLQNNDRLIVWKLPKTWSKLTGHAYIPNRGDIVIFQETSLEDKQLIKRVIGLPGDKVVINNGVVTVYNTAHPNGFDPDTTLPYSKTTHIPTTAGTISVVVQPGQVFVCGDNRPNSLDSRFFGAVPTQDIIGKLVLRILPLDKAAQF